MCAFHFTRRRCGPLLIIRHRTCRRRHPRRRLRQRDAKNMSAQRTIRAPRGSARTCKGWHQEAALRMLMNNLDPDVAENPDQLIVYGGTGRAARSWDAFDTIVRSLRGLENGESLLVQSGQPVGKFRRHDEAPRVLI